MATETTTVESSESCGKGAEMAATSFFVSCPCGCGEHVAASDAGFAATTVKVAACSKWAANGIRSSVLRKSWAYSNAVPVTGVQHVDGLVVFAQ